MLTESLTFELYRLLDIIKIHFQNCDDKNSDVNLELSKLIVNPIHDILCNWEHLNCKLRDPRTSKLVCVECKQDINICVCDNVTWSNKG
jgi:hypothetical protein